MAFAFSFRGAAMTCTTALFLMRTCAAAWTSDASYTAPFLFHHVNHCCTNNNQKYCCNRNIRYNTGNIPLSNILSTAKHRDPETGAIYLPAQGP